MAKVAPDIKKTCEACKRSRKVRSLVFTAEDFTPYCADKLECNEGHPNSTTNILERNGEKVRLYSLDELQVAHEDHGCELVDPQQLLDYKHLMSNPVSVRYRDSFVASVIAEVKAVEGHKYLSGAIIHLCQLGANVYRKMNPDVKFSPEQEEFSLRVAMDTLMLEQRQAIVEEVQQAKEEIAATAAEEKEKIVQGPTTFEF